MTTKRNTIAQKLHDAQVAINNTINTEVVQSAVTVFGYGPEQMGIGKALHEAAVVAVQLQQVAAGAQQDATARLKEKEKEAMAAYQDLAKVARAVFIQTSSKLVALGLRGRMPRATGAFIQAGYKLFDNSLLSPELASFGYDVDRLTSERAKIAAYEQADLEQEVAKGAAQHATQSQIMALDTMGAWVTQYLKIARVALRANPQFLEKLGVKARTSKTAAQRAASRRAASPEAV